LAIIRLQTKDFSLFIVVISIDKANIKNPYMRNK